MKKKILCSLLALLVINLSFPHVAWATEPTSGECGAEGDGSNVTWALDESGALTISGSGKMKDYNYSNTVPWYGRRDSIESVTIEQGVTSIGSKAFYSYTSLTSVTIPDSVTSIGNYAFYNCTSLTSVTIPDNVISIGDLAFYDCTSLTSVTIPSSVTYIGGQAFVGTPWLRNKQKENPLVIVNNILIDGTTANGDITIPDGVTSIVDSAFQGCTSLKTFFYKKGLDLTNASIPSETAKIAYTVNDKQSTPGKTEVTLVNTSQDVTIKCNAMGRYKITNVSDNRITLEHAFSTNWSKDGNNHWHECACGKEKRDEVPHNYFSDLDKVVDPTSDNLGGTKRTCTGCEYESWTNFTRDSAYNQTLMPDGETVYHYCTRNGLAAETTVDVGDGKTLRVFLQDPLGVLKKNESDVLGITVKYVEKGSARYNELMSQVDDDYPIEHINFFEVYPTVNGIPKTGTLNGSVYMEYEIPEDWDESDLVMILVQDGDDQELTGKVLEIDSKKYFAMWKNHFSPYAMIDKLTDKEKAALAAKTGDNSRSMVLTSSAMLIITGLFLEVCMKKKIKYQKALI